LRKAKFSAAQEFEKPKFCCHNGKVVLSDLPAAPVFLQELFDGSVVIKI
jgi:hypothetical protein